VRGVFDQAAVERLDDELDRAAEALLSDLQRVTHANMAEEIDLFVRALDADLIIPADF
jgi:nucleotide-binding universal stress UspA family protein